MRKNAEQIHFKIYYGKLEAISINILNRKLEGNGKSPDIELHYRENKGDENGDSKAYGLRRAFFGIEVPYKRKNIKSGYNNIYNIDYKRLLPVFLNGLKEIRKTEGVLIPCGISRNMGKSRVGKALGDDKK